LLIQICSPRRGYRVKMLHCTDTYSGCMVSGRHPARHLHRTDVLREQLPASRACCDCTVPSTPPFSGRVIYDKNENIAETSEKNVQSEHTLYTMHTQGVTLEFPATNSMYPTFRGLFSVRDPRFVHLSMS